MSTNDISTLSDSDIIAKVVSGELTRNKHYEFFNTDRGRQLHSKGKAIRILLDDIESGAVVLSETNDGDKVVVHVENTEKKYTKTVFFDKESWTIFNHIRQKEKQ